jgi:peptide chain release factor 2
LENSILELEAHIELIVEFPDELSLKKDTEKLITSINRDLKDFEIKAFLCDKYDSCSCYIMISSGAGGIDASDWAEMLLKMYINYCEKKGFKVNILSESFGSTAGIKSATVQVLGDYAYGFLKSEKGVHRLVRISPFDAKRRRHTSFALVDVLPIIPDIKLEISPTELRIDTFNASGHGGQNVQKNDTAVRVVHIPTGITAVCQSERSQFANKEEALRILYSKLSAVMEEEKVKEIKELKLKDVSAEWGNQIRSYVLEPYTLVKDLRTGYESADVWGVLSGDIDDIIWSFIVEKNSCSN